MWKKQQCLRAFFFFPPITSTRSKVVAVKKNNWSQVANVGIRVPRTAFKTAKGNTKLDSQFQPTQGSELNQVRFNNVMYWLSDRNLNRRNLCLTRVSSSKFQSPSVDLGYQFNLATLSFGVRSSPSTEELRCKQCPLSPSGSALPAATKDFSDATALFFFFWVKCKYPWKQIMFKGIWLTFIECECAWDGFW